ncbi:hypothetical protein [uncultured Erythrobacter sp.]|uniref:hypothetical protein n=1 Tax=uncultured Erythrobacter sp. TaxID=263913 RepID=UPI00260AFF5E|nr:hypothetical protein [uncultured Erythrobacter sp.]
MRKLILLLIVLAIGVGAYFTLRDDGLLEQVTEARVEQALLANGVPANIADCMAPRMVDRLSIIQLKKLERLAAEEGEDRVPQSMSAALERLRRVDDDEAVAQLARVGGRCGIEVGLEMFGR